MPAICQVRPLSGLESVCFEPVPRSALEGVVNGLELDPDHLERFLGPRDEIIAAVRGGSAHVLVAIVAGQEVIGFYVLHPDRRDGACWWLGWFALDRRRQGRGFGRASMVQIMGRFRRIPGCRRVRLLVAADNASALRLYGEAGFEGCGTASSGELVLERVLWSPPVLGRAAGRRGRNVARTGHRSVPGRLRLLAGPYAARIIGVERGPPALG